MSPSTFRIPRCDERGEGGLLAHVVPGPDLTRESGHLQTIITNNEEVIFCRKCFVTWKKYRLSFDISILFYRAAQSGSQRARVHRKYPSRDHFQFFTFEKNDVRVRK